MSKRKSRKALPASFCFSCSSKLNLLIFPHHHERLQNQNQNNAEFGIGSAQQFGDATINGKDFSKQDLRRSNFTSAECR